MIGLLSHYAKQPRKNRVKRPPHSSETKKKISMSLMGKKQSKEQIENARKTRIGKKRSDETRRKIGQKQKGEKNHNWKGGISWQTQMKNNPDYERATSSKPDRCDICGTHEKDLKRKLSFDHDHKTGKFRGWLCGSCNSGLGYARDSIEILKAMIDYLQKNI